MIVQQKKVIEGDNQQNYLIGGLVPLVVTENAWPFEDRSSKIRLNPKITKLIDHFESSYLPETNKHRLWWTSKVGTVTLEIKFKEGKRVFLVSVDMANLLLYLEKGSKMLTHFLCENCYSID